MIADCEVNNLVAKSLILNSILSLLLLAGCVAKPPAADFDLQFQIVGKIGVKQGPEGYSANFDWRQQTRNRYTIEVWGPLGQGRTQLEGDLTSMQVRRGGQLLALGRPEEVMQAHLGWSIPLDVLPAWIRGRPAAQWAVADVRYDDDGEYALFSQANWSVALSRFALHDNLRTPSRVIAIQDEKKITVIVRDYRQ
jgi:outer membrane lipoprotein LolB